MMQRRGRVIGTKVQKADDRIVSSCSEAISSKVLVERENEQTVPPSLPPCMMRDT